MDYYKILEIKQDASQEDIQKAYHALAIKYHPDANHGDVDSTEKFKVINKAYQVLRDREKRKEYDASSLVGKGNGSKGTKTGTQSPSSPRRPAPGSSVTDRSPLNDIIGDMFSSRQNAADTHQANRVEDGSGIPTVEISVNMRELASGASRIIKVNGRSLRIKIVLAK